MRKAHGFYCTINDTPMPGNHKDYDEEPVTYCSRCYSLKIKHEDITDSDVCMDCGCTETKTADIGTWERLYERRYGKKFVERSDDPRDSIFFKMPVNKLKSMLYRKGNSINIIHRLYHYFPKGLSKSESIILLFDKLCKDGRMDDLRMELYIESKKETQDN